VNTILLIGIGISIFLVSQSSSSLHAISCSYSSLSSCEKVRSDNLRLSFEYLSTWKIFEAGLAPGILKDFLGVISLDILNGTNEDEDDSGSYSGLENPVITITRSKTPFHNVTLDEYAKIRTLDFMMLFSDLDLHIIRSNQSDGEIDGVKYWIFEYSFSIDDRVDRYGMEIWMLRGDKVYEISYIADGYDEYNKNLNEVRNLVNSIYFID
jgi:hypothetical protein